MSWAPHGEQVRTSELWRYRLATRVVAFSVALGAVSGESQDACNDLFGLAMDVDEKQLREWAGELETQCKADGKTGVLQLIAVIAGPDRPELPYRGKR